MQVNCCVFPAPKQYQLTKILSKIVLIPKQPNNEAQYYCDKYIIKNFNANNQFMNHVRSRKINKSSTNISTQETQNMNRNKKFQIYSNLKEKMAKEALKFSKVNPLVLNQKLTQANIQKVKNQIPCVFLPSYQKQKILIFFHGNGEDLTTSYDFGYFINQQLTISVLIVEYQGYTIYEGSPSTNQIIADSKTIIEYLFKCGYQAKDIMLFGRSIGGAFAFEAASHLQAHCLILLSPFLSLKKVAEDLYGKCASSLLKQTLDNSSTAQNVKCPIFIIHGVKDTLVPYQHSISILKQCKGYTRLKLVQHMTHIKFNFRHDFILPVKTFLNDLNNLGGQ